MNDWDEDGVLSLLTVFANARAAFEGDDEIFWPNGPSRQFNSLAKVIAMRCTEG